MEQRKHNPSVERGTSSETGFVFMVVMRDVLQRTLRSFSIVFVRKFTVNLQVPQQILVIWPQFQAGIYCAMECALKQKRTFPEFKRKNSYFSVILRRVSSLSYDAQGKFRIDGKIGTATE